MPLPAIVGGSIIKVGGSIATATAINAIIAALTKLKLPKSKITEILIEKILDYTINQVTASGANTIETLTVDENVITTSESVEIPLPTAARALIVRTTDYPDGIGRRFSDTVPSGLPDKFYFGAVSFGGNTSIVDANGDPLDFDTGLSNEEQIVWERQLINIPRIGKDNDASKALLYVLPNTSMSVDILRVQTE
jgi:hypothetical protein